MKIAKANKDCVKCKTLNPNAEVSYRCAVPGTCPGLYGESQFKEGRLAYLLSNGEGDCMELCPYKQELGNDNDGIVHGARSSLWINGWFAEMDGEI